jgi:hypothetical protein
MFGLVLLAVAQLALADDPAPLRGSSRPAAAHAIEVARPARPVQPAAPSLSGNFRRGNLNPGPGTNYRATPLSRYRGTPLGPYRVATVPGGGRNLQNYSGAVASYDRTRSARTVQPVNTFRNVARGSGVRLVPRTGNELSYSQAQALCGRQHHDHDWWRHHHVLVVLYGGGYWYWNAGWWFPAWGYDPSYSNYAYDGPIYGYGEMSPGDVTSQVQEALAQQGYYYGPIDGILGPETRDAILRFQADHGLATTAAIDEPTLDSLGLT